MFHHRYGSLRVAGDLGQFDHRLAGECSRIDGLGNLGAAAANVRAVRQLVGPERRIFAVVKADGYGHGAAELGAVFVANGADALAVADLGEGIRLRQRGITAPILVYPNSLPEAAPEQALRTRADAAIAAMAAAARAVCVMRDILISCDRCGLRCRYSRRGRDPSVKRA